MSTTVLLLAGVTLNAFFSALILFVQYLADFAEVYRAARWLMGDLDVGGFEPIVAAAAAHPRGGRDLRRAAVVAQPPGRRCRFGLGARRRRGRARSAGRSSARRWPRAPRWRWPGRSASSASSCRTSSACSSASITASSCRRRRSSARRSWSRCDLVARTLLAPVEIPVGVVTAIIGGPFFLWLLVRETR